MNFASLTAALSEFSTLKKADGKTKEFVKISWVTCSTNADELGLINHWGIRWGYRYRAAYYAVLESVISDHHIVALGLHDGKALERLNDTFEMIVGYLNPNILVRGYWFYDTNSLNAYRLIYESVSSEDQRFH
jgi:hypothetical protein